MKTSVWQCVSREIHLLVAVRGESRGQQQTHMLCTWMCKCYVPLYTHFGVQFNCNPNPKQFWTTWISLLAQQDDTSTTSTNPCNTKTVSQQLKHGGKEGLCNSIRLHFGLTTVNIFRGCANTAFHSLPRPCHCPGFDRLHTTMMWVTSLSTKSAWERGPKNLEAFSISIHVCKLETSPFTSCKWNIMFSPKLSDPAARLIEQSVRWTRYIVYRFKVTRSLDSCCFVWENQLTKLHGTSVESKPLITLRYNLATNAGDSLT